jgi:hypothetical protein
VGLAGVAGLVGLFITTAARGVVIENTHLTFEPNTIFGADYAATVQQDAAASTYTQTGFTFRSSQLAVVWGNVDEGSDWYLVSAGDEFDAQTIAQHRFTILTIGGLPGASISILPGDFYLGVNTGVYTGGPPSLARDAYGWVKLHSQAGALTVVSNAVAYDPNGIIVGTTTIAPEPGWLLAAALVLPSLLARRRGTICHR